MWRPGGGDSRLTFRRLRVLIDHLPPESATKTVLRDGLSSDDWNDLPDPEGWGPWSNSDHLLAAIADRITHMEYVLLAINSEKGKGPDEPTPMSRPGVGIPPWERLEQQRRDDEQINEFLRYALEHNGAAPPGSWVPGSETRLDHGLVTGDAPNDEGGDLDG